MKEDLFLDICKENYLALMKMLEQAIILCPDELWANNTLKPLFWQEVYHTLYYLDFYLGDNWKKRPERFDVEENLEKAPDKTLLKEDLLSYLEEIQEKCIKVLNNLTSDDIEGEPSHYWTGETLGHKLVYNIRHSQHHVGKINEILHTNSLKTADWVIDANKKT